MWVIVGPPEHASLKRPGYVLAYTRELTKLSVGNSGAQRDLTSYWGQAMLQYMPVKTSRFFYYLYPFMTAKRVQAMFQHTPMKTEAICSAYQLVPVIVGPRICQLKEARLCFSIFSICQWKQKPFVSPNLMKLSWNYQYLTNYCWGNFTTWLLLNDGLYGSY